MTQDQLDHYLAHGYVTIPDALDASTLAEAREAADRMFPAWAPDVRGSHEWFPFEEQVFNTITGLPVFRRIARQILGGDVFCEQSAVRANYAGVEGDVDQSLHVDLFVHTLTYPSRQRRFWQVPIILYLTDTGLDDSPTHVVGWEHTQDEFLIPNHRERSEHPELYAKELPAVVAAGSLLVYNNRTFHRGSKFRNPRGRRVVQHMTFNPAGCEWMGYCSWAGRSLSASFRDFLARSSREEQAIFGFPAPGHPFWDDETLRGVAARYPGIDLSVYEAALTRA